MTTGLGQSHGRSHTTIFAGGPGAISPPGYHHEHRFQRNWARPPAKRSGCIRQPRPPPGRPSTGCPESMPWRVRLGRCRARCRPTRRHAARRTEWKLQSIDDDPVETDSVDLGWLHPGRKSGAMARGRGCLAGATPKNRAPARRGEIRDTGTTGFKTGPANRMRGTTGGRKKTRPPGGRFHRHPG